MTARRRTVRAKQARSASPRAKAPRYTRGAPGTPAFALEDNLQQFLADDALGGHSDAWGLISEPLGPNDITWATRKKNLTDAFDAWRSNPLARRIVTLTTDYVVGQGITVTSKRPTVRIFAGQFWNHRQNQMARRLPLMVDELTRSGELFTVLHRNPIDGMSYVRHLPASVISMVHWREGDYEQLIEVAERPALRSAGEQPLSLKWWPVYQPDRPDVTDDLPAVVLHHAINRPIGATRGEGDLDPILYWLQAYSNWLDGRVRLNDFRSKFYYEVTVSEADKVAEAQNRYRVAPASGSVVVHSAAETHTVQQPAIGADDAEADGRAIRLILAAGAHIPLHFLSEVMAGSTLGTSIDMNEPTFKHYATRQQMVLALAVSLVEAAYHRAAEVGQARKIADPRLTASGPEIQRDDNKFLGEAAKQIAEAFATMKASGLDRDERTTRLIYKFAGEILSDEEIKQIVTKAEAAPMPAPAIAGANGSKP